MQTGTEYGYVRISGKDQHEDRQIIIMQNQGVNKKNVITEKQSGKDFERKKYRRLVRKLKSGDTLFIESIDRLGRNYDEIKEQWRLITKKIGAYIVVLDMPLLDTRIKINDLTGQLLADIVLIILCYMAESERTKMLRRQAEGIAAAKAKGVKFGRPIKKRPKHFSQIYESWLAEELSARAAAKELGVAPKTFSLWANQYSASVTD
jgi:DNA invertase Pin-like site-specific DNA recombinase